MPYQQPREVCRKILVKQNSHLPLQFRKRRRAPLWRIHALPMETGAETHRALTAFKVVEKRADWNTGTDKHQTTAEDIRISVRDIGKCNHVRSPFGYPMLPQTLHVQKRRTT